MATSHEKSAGSFPEGPPGEARSGYVRIRLDAQRTPGLRREEVAQRANVSATWYTWLEQGRGGAPSADVLDRVAAAKASDLHRERKRPTTG